MMQRIEIFDVDKAGALAFDLQDILKILAEKYQSLRWYLLDLEATGRLNGDETMLEMERRVRQHPHGVSFNWDELTRFAAKIDQTINATLVGCGPAAPAPSMPLKPQDGIAIVVEAIDSTLWAVSTDDSTLLAKIQGKFERTKLFG